ncbi:hypothetical protein [Mycobacterium aquaticum]|uniref:hypothetical protein n=1 Tax=Mycobacterium aquaticum TaxID=1927124 RepID=UPI0009F21486|nr:hypothetical protein [Mycobacterium aquaticum]
MSGLDADTNATAADGRSAGEQGRGGASGVRDSARSQAAAIAPATGTPAGSRLMVSTMDERLAAMQQQIDTTKAQNRLLAARLRQVAQAYRASAAMGGGGRGMGGMGMPSFGGGGGGMPTGGGGGGGIPGLNALSSLSSLGRGGPGGVRSASASRSLANSEPVPSGPGAEAFRAAIHRALDIKGITDPVARRYWEIGMMVVAKRESDFNNVAVNNWDSNAKAGDPTVGTLQFKGTTFDAYHEPGTSHDRRDNVAQAAAFVNYAMGRYGVKFDGSDLAARIQQADPTRPAKGY